MSNELTVNQIVGALALVTILAKKQMIDEGLVDSVFVMLGGALKEKRVTSQDDIVELAAVCADEMDKAMTKHALTVLNRLLNPLNN